MTDTKLLHRVAEAMKERAIDCSLIKSIRERIRAIDMAALVKEVCGHE